MCILVAVRNDRNKKRKANKQDECASTTEQSEELTRDDELLIESILMAHKNTFPDLSKDDKEEMVSRLVTLCNIIFLGNNHNFFY